MLSPTPDEKELGQLIALDLRSDEVSLAPHFSEVDIHVHLILLMVRCESRGHLTKVRC